MCTRRLCQLFAVIALALSGLLALLFILLGGSPGVAQAGELVQPPALPNISSVRYVAISGIDTGDCITSAAPCRTVQYAVDAAGAGDTIKVATGTYTGVQNRPAPAGYSGPTIITQVAYISKTVSVHGGYTTTNGFADPPDPQVNLTTLNAQGQGRVIFAAENVSPTIEGLRITGGNATGQGGHPAGPLDAGGGVYLYQSNDAALKGNDIYSNTAPGMGGGVYMYHSINAGLTDNHVHNNGPVTYSGGGVYVYLSDNAMLASNQVYSNTVVGYYGGGILLYQCNNAELVSNLVYGNTAHSDGGISLWNSSDLVLSGNQVYRNIAQNIGGIGLYFNTDALIENGLVFENKFLGLYIAESTVHLLHATIARNYAQGIYLADNVTLWMTNTALVSHTVGLLASGNTTATLEGTLWGSGVWANGTDVVGWGVISTGTVNVWGNPDFVDPGASDYHIGPDSAAIDAGVDAGVTTDIDGDPRPLGNGYDIGADEYPSVRYVATSGVDASDCTDNAAPCRTVQYAVDVASEGDTVKVAQGIYTDVSVRPRDDFTTTGVVTQVAYISKTVMIRGGYAAANWDVSNPISYPTTLDAQGGGRVLYITGNISPVIEGLRITGGSATGLGGDWLYLWGDAGGGAYIISATAALRNCQVFSNTASDGGGLYLAGTDNSTLDRNRVFSNTAGSGGGLVLHNSNHSILNNNTVISNVVGGSGGGLIVLSSDNTALVSNTIAANTASYRGGGLFLDMSSNITLTGNIVTSNTAIYWYGGGIYLDGSNHVMLSDNMIVSNTSEYEGGGLYLWTQNTTLDRNVIAANKSLSGFGGGLYLRARNVALTHNVIVANAALNWGGGFYLDGCQIITASGNIVNSNTANFGGGAYLRNSDNVTLGGNTIVSNTAEYEGGGLALYGSDAALSGNIIISNTANRGGGLELRSSAATCVNDVIAGNQASTDGSGLRVAGSSLYLLQATMARNTGGDGSGINIYNEGSTHSALVMTNTILVSHTIGISVTGGNTVTVNGILWYSTPVTVSQASTASVAVQNQHVGDPAFAADGYHLTSGSAAIDAGVDSGVTTDIDGKPRPIGKGYDLGADEYQPGRYVATTGSDTTDCTDSAAPCRTVQYAVDVAVEGDAIKVATGTYTDVHSLPIPSGYPYPPASGLITQVVYISKTVIIQGGYTIAFTEPPNPDANPTTLDAQGQGRVLVIAGNISPTIEGLRFTDGNAIGLGGNPDWYHDVGGGVYVISSTATLNNNWIFGNTAYGGGGLYLLSSTVMLTTNTIASNTVSYEGGGLYVVLDSATLSGNTIFANVAETGGGLFMSLSNATVTTNTIASNTATWDGGGLVLYSGNVTLSKNIISANSANVGGGLELSYSSAMLSENIVISNSASYEGGGGLYLYHSPATLDRNTISANSGPDGGGLYLDGSSATLNMNNIVSNTAGYGGGAYLGDSPATLDGNLIANNMASWAGGLYLGASSAMLSRNIVASNSAAADGGGLYLSQGSNATLENDIIAHNQAGGAGSGLYILWSSPQLLHTTLAHNTGGSGYGICVPDAGPPYSTLTLTNTILVSHTVGIVVNGGNSARLEATLWGNDTDWSGNVITGTPVHNYWGVPAFVNPDAGNYHLGPGNAAIDAGVDAGVTTDIDGDPRPMGNGFDLGADEFRPVTSTPGVPALLAPPNGTVTTTQTITFTWHANAGAGDPPEGYNLQLNSGDGYIAIITTTTTTSPTLLPVGVYTWTVRAFNDAGYSAWAAAWTVEVIQHRLYLPIILK